MSRFDSLQSITGAPGEPPASLGGVEDDFLSRVNKAMVNFKEILEMAKEMRGMAPGASSGPGPAAPGGRFDKVTILKIIDLVIAKGYGSATIGDLITQASPLTLTQLRGIIDNAGPGK